MISHQLNPRSDRRTGRLTRFVISGVILAGFFVTPAGSSFGQPIDADNPDISLEEATHALVGLGAEHKIAPHDRRSLIHDRLLAHAAHRNQRLAALIEKDPQEVLRLAMPARHRAKLPPAVRAHVEQEVTDEGELEVLHEDNDHGGQFHYFLNSGAERVKLHFAAHPPRHHSGTRVRVSGVRVNQAVAAASGTTSMQVLAAPLSNTYGVQQTAVILVNFQNSPTSQSIPVAGARDVVFTQVSNFDNENSYGQTSLGGDVFGWYTIPMNSTGCDYYGIASLARQAATNAGVNLSGYRRLVYAFPSNSCGWWGLGTVGGNPSQAWINGSFQSGVVAHEMGHNFGLWHSHALECGTATIGGSCTNIEYGDVADVMGSASPPKHFNAYQKELLGWLNAGNSPPLTYVQSGGTYIIDGYETPGSASKALKIQNGTNSAKYYVEFRRPIGFDSVMSGNANIMNGVLIHSGDPSNSNTSYLLDMTPLTSSWSDPALSIGSTFTDPVTGLNIQLQSITSTSATVNVFTGGTACVRANPTISISPSQSQWVSAGTKVSYSVTVTNHDNSGCTNSTFTLAATVPGAGWTANFGQSALTLGPGASASTSLDVTSPSSAQDAFYTISVKATNSTYSTFFASTSATYVVSTGTTPGTFTDNFNRQDSTLLGASWTEVGNLVISSNQLKNGGSGNNYAAVAALGGATQSAEADFTSVRNDTGGHFGVILRYQDPKNYYMLYRKVGGSSVLRISKVVNGVETVLVQKGLPNPKMNTPFHLKGSANGSTLTLQVGTVNVSISSDGTFATGGLGIVLGTKAYTNTVYNQTVVADNFSATAN